MANSFLDSLREWLSFSSDSKPVQYERPRQVRPAQKVQVDPNEPIGYKLFNPGNVRPHKDYDKTPWLGGKETQDGYVKFKHPMWGFRAMVNTLKKNNLQRNMTTPYQLIGRYLGTDADKTHKEIKNKTNREIYLKGLESMAGVKGHQPLNFKDDAQLFNFAKAMSRHEIGTKYYDQMQGDTWLQKGIELDR